MIGTTLGPYRVAARLGAGGMGEVYRATDTNLGREVAIKVLPEALATDPDRLARFEREARTLASLSHPNIAAVYGVERAEGRTALVMELVEGETLADRIARGPVPVDEALPIARQIAEALGAAHEHHIIHRDLKPANVKVGDDGDVKVLDFGLAKSIEPAAGSREPGSTNVSNSPTITTPAMTQAGVILGTAAYMSPEQARGRVVDRRTDVWAFGCVLFEMLTGRRAFPGEDTTETIASVMKGDPEWTALPPHLPPAVRTLVQRCLVKDRRQRIADIAVAGFVLAEHATLAAGADRAAAARGTAQRSWALPMAAAAIVAGALAGLAGWMLAPRPADPAVARFVVRLPDDQRFTQASRQQIAISPDGRRLAYQINNRLYLRSIAEFDAREVAGTNFREGIANPVFSPDGESLAFFTPLDYTIKRVAVAGGTPVTVCVLPERNGTYGLTWEASGIVFSMGFGGVYRCPATGGTPERLAVIEPEEQAHGATILPGDNLLFSISRGTAVDRWDKAAIVVQSLDTGARRVLFQGGSDARYVRSGHLLYTVSGTVFAVAFDAGRQALIGGPVPVVEGVSRGAGVATGGTHLAVSESGTLAYLPGPARSGGAAQIAISDRSGAVQALGASGPYSVVRASRDGTVLAVGTDDGREANILTGPADGTSPLTRLTFSGHSRYPVLSPDGQRVAFQSDKDGDLAIFAQRRDGTGLTRLTKPDKDEAHLPESWSPHGKHLSFSIDRKGQFSLAILSLPDGAVSRFGTFTSREWIGSVFAPDGKWIAYHVLPADATPQGADAGIFVKPFPDTGPFYQAPRIIRDFHPVWSADGSQLIYIPTAGSGRAAAVPVTTRAGVSFGTPVQFPFTGTAGRLSSGIRSFDVLPDGRLVGLMAANATDRPGADQGSEIHVVLNWFEELKRLAPR